MKKALLFFIIAAASLRGFAQNADSLSAVRAVDSLLKVSQALIDQRSFDKALENNAAAEKLALEKFGKQSAAYGSVCYNHARALHMAGIILEAEKWYLESKAVREKIFDREHPDCVAIQHNLGNVYRAMGQYEKAEALHLEVKAIREKTIGKDNSDYAGTLINLGNVYSHLSNYEKAESHYLEAKEIFEVKLKDKKHAFYANCLNNLANLYRTIGEYEKAEPIFLESKTIMENTFGKKNPRYPFFIGNMAGVYLEMGNYEKAEPLYIECRDILENTVGKENPDYALSLSNLGMVYMRMGNHEKSLAFFREARDILLKTVGKDNVQYAHSLNFLATSYVEMDKFAEAEALQLEAKSILEKALGKENIDYASCLINLSTLYAQTGDYDKVEALSLETMPILEKILGREHPSYTSTLLNLTVIYEITGRLSESESLLKEVTTLEQARLSKGVSFLPERELMNYVAAMNKSEIHLGSYVLVRSSRGEISGNLPAFNYDQTLFHKGFLLSSAVRLNRLAMSTPDAAEVNNRLKGYRRRLAAEYAKPIADRKGLKELEEQANTFEKELARLVAGYEETNRQVNWQSVQHSLKADEAAIEFIHFQYASPKVTDSIVYAALLLRPSWPQPRMIGLFEQRAIQPLLSAANPGAVAEKLYASRGGKKRGRAAKNEGIVVGIGESASLWQLVWQPLDSLLQGVKTVYFSPSGLLHQINLSAVPIPGAGDQTLADRYSLVHLGSTRQLVSGSGSGNSSGKSAALFGGLQFDTPATAPGARGNVWNYLPGTEKEIRNIAKTLGKAGYTVQSSAGYDGTETVFKTLGTNNVSSPAVLHIATHGFFFPDPKDTVNRASFAVDREPVFKTSDNPLLRSGLLFAGANPAWAGGKTPEGQDDGILTAYEISQMNLSNTELVVLSACETGLGDIQGNEGVYGLQRAFKIAGAKYLIMSLWQVPDKETSEFMTAFYRKWLEEKMEIPDAFRAAQKEMREQGLVPYQWAGFVLIE